MKLLILLCACAALTSGLPTSRRSEKKRFLSSVTNFFSHAADVVENHVEDAAHAVAGAATDAVDAVEGAVDKVGDAVGDAAHTVGDALTDAAHSVGDFVGEAKDVLEPLIDQAAAVVGPIAKELLQAAVQKLVDNAPELLAELGQAGVQALAQAVLESGKRDVADMAALQQLFSELVEQGVNKTVEDVHRVLSGVDKFNQDLTRELATLERALKSGQDATEVAGQFFVNMLGAVQPLIDMDAFSIDVNSLDNVIPHALSQFKHKLESAVQKGTQKRFLFPNPLEVIQDVVGLVQQGQQNVATLVNTLQQLADAALKPSIDNVKALAQTLLDNASGLTSQLVQQAMVLLAPYQAQLGPLFQQVQTLAANFGLPALG